MHKTFLKPSWILLEIVVVFLICNTMLSCSESNKTKNDSKVYSSNLHHAQFEYPSNWELSFQPDSTNPNAILSLKNPIENQADLYAEEINIVHEQLPIKISDSLYHASTIGQIKITNPDLEIENTGKQKYGNHSFSTFKFEFTPDSGKSYYQVNGYTLQKDSMAYTINLTTESKQSKSFEPIIESLLKSFKAL